MGRVAKEVSGQVLCFMGFVGVCLTCGIPMWRVTTYIGANIVTGQIIWDGLWMQCVMQSTGQMQCSLQSSIMGISQDLQAGQALTVISLVVAFIGFALSFVGVKCTSCLSRDVSQTKVVILSGIICIIAGVLCLIPTAWSAAIAVTDYENPVVIQSQKREIGASIFIGWGSSILLIIGGSVLCSSCPPQDPKYFYQTYPPQYTAYPGSIYTARSYMPAKTYMPPKTYSPARQYGPASRPTSPGQYL
ncbi:claudin f [Scleropages formosus]|uniref:claudin f n=1 Tax=Scleropages formosus TaxID=113540 RepID=UPI000878DF73|nr:claudin-4-like [Scleropages formosus]